MKYADYRRKLAHDPAYQEAEREIHLQLELADILLRARLAKGWTQTELARRVGSKQANISRLESGLGNPTLEFISRVAEMLGVEITLTSRPLSVQADQNLPVRYPVNAFPSTVVREGKGGD